MIIAEYPDFLIKGKSTSNKFIYVKNCPETFTFLFKLSVQIRPGPAGRFVAINFLRLKFQNTRFRKNLNGFKII